MKTIMILTLIWVVCETFFIWSRVHIPSMWEKNIFVKKKKHGCVQFFIVFFAFLLILAWFSTLEKNGTSFISILLGGISFILIGVIFYVIFNCVEKIWERKQQVEEGQISQPIEITVDDSEIDYLIKGYCVDNNPIANNPFRMLNTYIDDVNYTELALKRMKIYHGIYEFTSIEQLLGGRQITVEAFDKAMDLIRHESYKIGYAMFWFMKGDNPSETTKKVNQSVRCIIQKDLVGAVSLINDVISDDQLRKEFVNQVCGDTYSASKEVLMKLYLCIMLSQFSTKVIQVAVANHSEMNSVFQQLLNNDTITSVLKVKTEQQAHLKAQTVDPSICFYCGNPANKKEHIHLKKETSENNEYGSGVIKRITRTYVDIPICSECEDYLKLRDNFITRHQSWTSFLNIFFTIIILIAIFLWTYKYLDEDFWLTLIILVLPGWIIGCLLLWLLYSITSYILMTIFNMKHRRQFIHHVEDHPEVVQLMREGYKLDLSKNQHSLP